jgi:hypothetical protein
MDFTFKVYIDRFQCAGKNLKTDYIKTSLKFLIPSIISLAYIASFLLNVSSIIEEKESKMKEYLKIIGAKPIVLTLCWIIKSYLIYLVTSIAFTVILKRKFDGVNHNASRTYLPGTSYFIVFITIHTFAVQVNLLSILVGQIFNKSKQFY